MNNSLVIEGVHLKESWIRGMTDYTDSNGLGTSYVTYVMAIEKNVRWGQRLSTPLGVALLSWAVVLVATRA